MWIMYAFISAIFAGITSILAKIGIKNTDSNLATALRTIVILAFAWIMVFVVGSQGTIGDISRKSFLFLIFSGLTTGASWICYFKAIQLGDVNKVVPIDKTSTVLTMILAFIFLQEPISIYMVIGMILILGGTLAMVRSERKPAADAYTESSVNEGKPRIDWLVYGILSAVFASMTSILAKVGITGIESHLGTAIRTTVVFFMAWLLVFYLGKQKEVKDINKRSWVFILLSGLTTGLSWLFYYRALQDGLASVVVPIDKLSIVVTVAFAYVFLKEKITKRAFVGLIGIIAGTLLLLINH